jgi:predicted metalloprotease with PDZ domain
MGVGAIFAVVLASGFGVASAQTPIALSVDLTDAPKKILHATEEIPVSPGPNTLVYPKWIPGEHMPSGPIDDMAGFFITGNGQAIRWERDPVDMFAFHFDVPQGVSSVEVKMDFLATPNGGSFTAGGSTSANLAMLSWNTLVLYPQGKKSADVTITPSVTLPPNWKFGTALELPEGAGVIMTPESPTKATFKTVSLEQLIDSPVLTGRFFREIPLAPDVTPKHFLDMAADGPEDLNVSKEHIDEFSKLVRQTGLLYRSRHYASYHFLVTLSDQVLHFGLEHHQSSDDRVEPTEFISDEKFILDGLLLPHEFTHSWNGKYRRPAGLATPNYQEPMIGDGLWVYEGMTEYLGDVLTARCGIWTAAQYRDRLATVAAAYDMRPGRTWRDLQDTARMAQILYNTGGPFDNWRRATDFYDEGELIWLDVDTTIRKLTDGKKSLNDFEAAFLGLNGNTGPQVIPYTFEDVVAGLNGIVPYDWKTFLRFRLDTNRPEAPLGGIENGGWKLIYKDKPNEWTQMEEGESGTVNFWYSIGLHVGEQGSIGDVLHGGIADKAGFGPEMKIVAVNGRAYSPDVLRMAIRDAKGGTQPIEFIVENTGFYKVLKLDYHDGEKYPALVRVEGTPDRLDEILKPMTK